MATPDIPFLDLAALTEAQDKVIDLARQCAYSEEDEIPINSLRWAVEEYDRILNEATKAFDQIAEKDKRNGHNRKV